MNTISLPPRAPVLIEATRAIGYSAETAIADVLDNSIAAQARHIEINFLPYGEPFVAMLDNGCGMNESELLQAMRFGSRDPLDLREPSDLGRFGLGMKTASLSQCRQVTVISKKAGNVAAAQWDLDLINQTGEWSLGILNSDDIEFLPYIERLLKYESGTLVIWQKLDRMKIGDVDFSQTMAKKMDHVRSHISLVFHRYIKGEQGLPKVEVTINDLRVEPADPFLIGKSTLTMDDEIINIDGKKIQVRPYTLPHLSNMTAKEIAILGGKEGLRKQQGFYVYRNKRLLVWGTWFRLMRSSELSKLARVQVDVPNSLDYLWSVDIKKSTAIPPEIVKKNLAIMIDKIADSSKKTWIFRGKKEIGDNNIHIWNRIKTRHGGIIYEINREHPLVEAVLALGNSQRTPIEHVLLQIERFLPLNQLYIDLTSDERISNSTEVTKDDVLPLFRQLMAGCKDDETRSALISRLAIIEPFNQHPEWLTTLWQEAN